jgi:PP-loop superfamily ATP-utilizing enzyme
MPEKALKLVLSLDAETNWYKPVAHNLSLEQASEFVQQSALSHTLIAEQKDHHRASKAEKCKACKEIVLEYTAQRSDAGPEPPAAQESEA